MITNGNLSDLLQSIVYENPNKRLLVNDFFRLPKENQEFLKRYQGIQWEIKKIYIKLILQVPFFLINTCINLFLSIFYIKQNYKFKRSITNTDVLFISHATTSNAEHNSDIYFEDIPNKFLDNKKEVGILYLNHNKTGYSRMLKKLILKNNSHLILLMPKIMGPFDSITYFRFIIIEIANRVILSRSYKLNDIRKSRIVLYSIFSLMKRETYSNFHLLKKYRKAINNSPVENVFLTLEGHGYEEEIINQTYISKPNAVIWLRQHSPISLAQIGVFNILKSLKKSTNVLTTGLAYSNLFNQHSKNIKTFTIGTSKSRAIHATPKRNFAILVAPEGTEKSTLEFLDFIFNLNDKFNGFEFIFRIHPNLDTNWKIRKKIQKNLSKLNFRVSAESLDQDLMQSSTTLYRSSAVAIESLAYGNLPIYLNFDGNPKLDVFSVIENNFPKLHDLSDFHLFFKMLSQEKSYSVDPNIYTHLFKPIQTNLVSEYIFRN